MSQRSDVSPSVLGVELDDEVTVEYLDGRRTVYRGPREAVAGSVRCRPGKDVHVLVTDESETQGVLLYVNDRKTRDDILESSGVGRVLLDTGESSSPFPGVTARIDGYAVEVEAEPAVTGGRVFVFEEDELGERVFEIVEP